VVPANQQFERLDVAVPRVVDKLLVGHTASRRPTWQDSWKI
jgi:hypothetical protein